MYEPDPPTEVYFRPVSEPDVDEGVTISCASAAYTKDERAAKVAERRMMENSRRVVSEVGMLGAYEGIGCTLRMSGRNSCVAYQRTGTYRRGWTSLSLQCTGILLYAGLWLNQ